MSEPQRTSWRAQLRGGLRYRSTVTFAAGALAITAAVALITYALTRAYLVDQRESTALRQSYVNARLVRSVLETPGADVPTLLAGLGGGGSPESVVRVGDQWFSTSVTVDQDSVPPALRQIVDAGGAGHQRFDLSGTPTVGVGVALPAANAQYYEFFALEELDETLTTLATSLAVASIITAALAGAAGYFASRRVLRPLRQVAGTAAHIAGGDLDERLDTATDVDLAPLTAAFNDMVEALADRIDREIRFTSDVSHELRSPLATMAATIQVMERRRDDLPENLVGAFDVLSNEVQTFQDLVTDLLEISRIEAGVANLQAEPLDPVELVRQVLKMPLETDATIDVVGKPPMFMGDKRRLAQVFVNLLTNADRYAGGADRITVAATGDGHGVRFAVEDRGPGVQVSEREAIFGRFARGSAAAQSSARGSGLGLALARDHVRLHGGQLWVEDRDGGGARFVIEFPAGTPR